MKFLLTINMDNAAFAEDEGGGIELARILREVADRVDGRIGPEAGSYGGVRDTNGNKCGRWEVTE